ncbi:hypothetical protein QO179_24500 [Bacillus stercoris]|nr:hypothetical protein [Bacillus stercoris]
MIIKDNLRPTMIRTNSRFRGPTELNKYSNFILETVHDMKLLGSVMDRNEYVVGHRGQTDYINDNFVALVNGGTQITSNIGTASIIYHPTDNVFEAIDLMSTDWGTYGECTKSEGEKGTILTTTGLKDPSGISRQKYVEEGDIIYIRMGVRLLSGDGTAFTIGSHDINQGEGDIKKIKIPQNGGTIYVDKRLHCLHREPISINIDVHNTPDMLQATSIEIFDLEIRYMTENKVTVQPNDTVVKSRINSLEDKIWNIINNS